MSRERWTAVMLLMAGWMAMPAGGGRHLEAAGPRPAAPSTSAAAAQPRAVLDQYCVSCHNEKRKTAGLTLEQMDVANVGAGAEVWEKVIRKLRTGAMPPSGAPRPDPATSDRVASYLETALDRAAAARPNPGRPETLHRLNRYEYQNTIRDLLALDVDVTALLPADDGSYGFDNMAGALKLSPTLLDRYMAAARYISRLAVGSRLPPTADTFRLRLDLAQDTHIEGLPFGTRGGIGIRYTFPLDGEYVIQANLQERDSGPLGLGTDLHQLEVSVDGARVQLFPVGGKPPVKGDEEEAYAGADDPKTHCGGQDGHLICFEVRVPVQAGSRLVTVTFVEKTAALAETLREPFGRPHFESDFLTYEPHLASVTIAGPFAASGAGDTPSRRRLLLCHPATRASEAGCATQVLSTVARRAYRRPVTPEELQVLVSFYHRGRAKGSFEAGIEMALRRLLVSPDFLFRIERDPAHLAPETAYRLSDLDLASRLSFFLWSSIPDDALLAVAIRGTLHEPAVLEQHVRRMVADPRSEALAVNFAGQWLYLRNLPSVEPNGYLFPRFGEGLRRDFRRETELFFASILREQRSVLDLLRADHTFLNEALAKHYGIPGVYGSHFRRVTLPDEQRRGLLGQGSILTVTSYADRTSVVGRGKWILENILGAPPPPPPPNVPALKANTDQTGKVLTMRERMAQHRANPVCAGCHARMDPLGFALENFDATGRWRTTEHQVTQYLATDNFAPIDASAVLPDGTTFAGPAGLRGWLLTHPEQIVFTLTEKLLTYAVGRGLEYYDAPAVRGIVRDAERRDASLVSLIIGVVKSPPFQMRRSQS